MILKGNNNHNVCKVGLLSKDNDCVKNFIIKVIINQIISFIIVLLERHTQPKTLYPLWERLLEVSN